MEILVLSGNLAQDIKSTYGLKNIQGNGSTGSESNPQGTDTSEGSNSTDQSISNIFFRKIFLQPPIK